MDITKLTTEQLKALAYDEMVKIQIAQNNLQLIQQQMDKLLKEENGITDKQEAK